MADLSHGLSITAATRKAPSPALSFAIAEMQSPPHCLLPHHQTSVELLCRGNVHDLSRNPGDERNSVPKGEVTASPMTPLRVSSDAVRIAYHPIVTHPRSSDSRNQSTGIRTVKLLLVSLFSETYLPVDEPERMQGPGTECMAEDFRITINSG
jgi:hypothetical protein